MGLIYAAYAACCLATLLRCSPAWWRWLNRAGADIGRSVAWLCSGGPGWKLARMQLEQARRADRMAALLIDAAGWRREAARRAARQHRARLAREALRCPDHCAWCPGGNWCANVAAAETRARMAPPAEDW